MISAFFIPHQRELCRHRTMLNRLGENHKRFSFCFFFVCVCVWGGGGGGGRPPSRAGGGGKGGGDHSLPTSSLPNLWNKCQPQKEDMALDL